MVQVAEPSPVLACTVEHSSSKDLLEAMTEVPAPRSRVKLIQLESGAAVPVECRHCDAAACIAACPTNALVKSSPDAPVVLLDARCVGCASCMVACPYGVVRHDGDKQIYKCDLCVERLAKSQIPACVDACPTGCLTFKSQDQVRGWLRAIEQLGHQQAVPRQEG